jgi:hypothetical protein
VVSSKCYNVQYVVSVVASKLHYNGKLNYHKCAIYCIYVCRVFGLSLSD